MKTKFLIIGLIIVALVLVVTGVVMVFMLRNNLGRSTTFTSDNANQQESLEFTNNDASTTIDKTLNNIDKQTQNIDNNKDFEDFNSDQL